MATDRSSANPFKLSQYATDGMALATTLQDKATALSDAADALARAGESIPGLSDFVAAFTELAADWYHLDEHAGDVANGFFGILEPQTRALVDPNSLVLSADDDLLGRIGQIGFADRQQAIDAAEDLAADLQQAMEDAEDGELTRAEMEELTARARRGQYDPAFAVTFVTEMGVNGMVDLRELFHEVVGDTEVEWSQDDERAEIEERLGWIDDQMLPFAGILTTAMDTRRANDPSHLHDPQNAHLADADRLSEAWVTRFEEYSGEQRLDYSELVRAAELPADVLVDVGDNHLDDILQPFDYDDPAVRNASYYTNILEAIEANPDASTNWLDSTGIDGGSDPRNNMELFLQLDDDIYLTSHVGEGSLWDGLAGVLESGLTNPGEDEVRQHLMEQAVTIVGGEDEHALDYLRFVEQNAATSSDELAHGRMAQALAEGAAANMDVVGGMISADWEHPELGGAPPASAEVTHEFLVEVMREDSTPVVINAAVEEYSLQQIRQAPPPGVDSDGNGIEDRTEALRAIGTVQGTVVGAESSVVYDSVEEYLEYQETKADVINFAVGLGPFRGGEVVGAANDIADIYGVSLGELVSDSDLDNFDDAEQRAYVLKTDQRVNNAILLTAAEDPSRAATPVRSMSEEERQAWLDSLVASPIYDGDDLDNLGQGSAAAWDVFLADRWKD